MKQETGAIPDSHVIGVLTTSDEAGIRHGLETDGFHDVKIMTDRDIDREVDASGEHANPVVRVCYQIVNHLSEQVAYLEQYQEEARRGNRVIAVRVEDDDEAQAAAQILGQYGAVNLRYFGRLAIRDITPVSNPSAASDQPR